MRKIIRFKLLNLKITIMAKNDDKNKADKKDFDFKKRTPEEIKGTPLEGLIPIEEEETESIEETAQEEAQEISPYDQMSEREKAQYVTDEIIRCLEYSTAEHKATISNYRIFDVRHGAHVAIKKNEALLKILLSEIAKHEQRKNEG